MLGWHGTVMVRVSRRQVLVRDDDTVLGTHTPSDRWRSLRGDSASATSRCGVGIAQPQVTGGFTWRTKDCTTCTVPSAATDTQANGA